MSFIDNPAEAPPPPKPGEAPPAPPPAKPPADESKRFDGKRPDNIPEKFWKDGKLNGEALLGSYNELEKWKGTKEEELKKQIDAERFKERPAEAGKYELPKIENVDQDELAKHPLVEWWRGQAFNAGLSQKQFQEGIELYIKNGLEGQVVDLEAEKKSLGENAQARITAVSAWANKHFEGDEFKLIQKYGSSATGIKLIEKIMKMTTGGGGPGGEPPPEPQLTAEKLREMQADPRYWNAAKRDPDFVKAVEDGYAKLYPKKT